MTSYSKTDNGRSESFVKKHRNKIIIAAGIVGAILILGYLFSGGTVPNGSIGSVFDPLPVYKSGMGSVNGYVAGPLGLPAVGSTIIAAEQGGTAVSKSAFISVDGKYVFSNLPAGDYILMVAFPDGTNRVLDNVRVEAGSIQSINIKY